MSARRRGFLQRSRISRSYGPPADDPRVAFEPVSLTVGAPARNCFAGIRACDLLHDPRVPLTTLRPRARRRPPAGGAVPTYETGGGGRHGRRPTRAAADTGSGRHGQRPTRAAADTGGGRDGRPPDPSTGPIA